MVLPSSPPHTHTCTCLQNSEWVLATSEYGGEFVAAVRRGNVYATQFHPEKSGAAGLDVLRGFLEPEATAALPAPAADGNGGWARRCQQARCPGALLAQEEQPVWSRPRAIAFSARPSAHLPLVGIAVRTAARCLPAACRTLQAGRGALPSA